LEEKAKEPIKVFDRRHFTSEGDRRTPDAEQEGSPAEASGVAAAPAASAPTPAGEKPGPSDEEEPSLFSDLVLSLAQSCFLSLGLVPNPMTGRPELNLPAAASMLDMLEMLRKKTEGNLSIAEREFLDHTLMQLKMGYVQASQAGAAPEDNA
jgi:hypothetical protein